MLRAAFRSACAVWPQDRQTKRAWLSRDSAAVYPQARHRCDVYAALTCSTRPGAFCSSRVTSTPQPLSRMARFRPAFGRTFVPGATPGASMVPLAERVMLRTRRSSTRIRSKRRARSVESLPTQSLRASARRACRRANLALTRRRRLLPRWARQSRRWVRRSCASRESVSNRHSSPVDSAAATATPRSAPTTSPVPGADRGVAVAAALSAGELLRFDPDSLDAQVRRTQRRLCRAQRGSHRRRRVKARLARLHARRADARKDWVEKLSTDLARRFDLIRVEDLRVRNMTRSAKGTVDAPGTNVRQKAGLNRAILAKGWGVLVTRLEQKAPGRVT